MAWPSSKSFTARTIAPFFFVLPTERPRAGRKLRCVAYDARCEVERIDYIAPDGRLVNGRQGFASIIMEHAKGAQPTNLMETARAALPLRIVSNARFSLFIRLAGKRLSVSPGRETVPRRCYARVSN